MSIVGDLVKLMKCGVLEGPARDGSEKELLVKSLPMGND